MPKPLLLAARAKINLALDILHKRADGYHEVAMIMQSVRLADRVELWAQPAEISVSVNITDLDPGPDNLAYRAAALLRDQYGIRHGVRIVLQKRIPLAAGLAGGSADAAAVLRGLNQLWQLGLSPAELAAVGALLGSDVPFCLQGGTQLATGRGEILQSLPEVPHAWVVLAKPPVAVSTAWVYGQYRTEQVNRRPDIAAMVEGLAQGDLTQVARQTGNVLETVTEPTYPVIAAIKKIMLDQGALTSLMSGSGPTVFGLTASEEAAVEIAAALSRAGVDWVVVTETVGKLGEKDGSTFATSETG